MAVNKRLAKKRAAKKLKEAVKAEAAAEEMNEKTVKEEKQEPEVQLTLVVQSGGKEVSMEEAVSRVKNAWISQGNAETDLKKLEIYIKPEDGAIYYVANGENTGKTDF